ncbi:uncharacterized protein [Haliotis cracherodii]|uniref:uncharacterized protein n=1 Tax=Haliotis cracherodii TaxID=6455 RepID=UPI0039E9389E
MSRGVRDLRDLICVSRLTVRESDEEIISDEELNNFDSLSISSDSGSDNKHGLTNSQGLIQGGISPDSGFVTNGSPSEVVVTANVETQISKSQKRAAKRRRKKKELETFPSRHDLPKPPPLPPVQGGSEDFSQDSVQPDSESSRVGNSSAQMKSRAYKKSGNYDDMLCYMDATLVSGWLTQANDAVGALCKFCHAGDNYVQFAHFWLSSFSDVQKHEIFEMEYEILIEEMSLAFSVGREQRKVLRSDITNLASALLVEYPSKLMSSKGNHLFLDYLDILSSEKREQYKNLLSNVRCSTKNRQYAQWLLATRSFALVSMWSAITNFYQNLTGIGNHSGLPLPSSVSCLDASYQRMYQAVRLGYVDVLHYLLVGGHVKPHHLDSHQRSLIFTAVMHNQEKVLHYLLTRVHPAINPNQPADTGNTPLHAAANSGNLSLVVELLKCPYVQVSAANPQCEQATPLHLAVMHGHEKVVEVLVEAKADLDAKMGDLTPSDIARDFGKQDLQELLTS